MPANENELIPGYYANELIGELLHRYPEAAQALNELAGHLPIRNFMNLPTRVRNALADPGTGPCPETPGDLARLTAKQLLSQDRIGPKGVEEIAQWLARYGKRLKADKE